MYIKHFNVQCIEVSVIVLIQLITSSSVQVVYNDRQVIKETCQPQYFTLGLLCLP